uniref:Uncharacterized protein n=1 Tax=Methanococcus maripaludis (strain C6 / ATCC BAA-1332) TaxID=444158 RepID=A9A7X0_METM6
MDILISINPKWAKKIKDGSKTVELRKTVPNFAESTVGGDKPREWLWYLYESAPVKKVIGFFQVGQVFSGPPAELWKEVKKTCGLTEDQFFEYCSNPNKKYYGLEIKDLVVWDETFDPYKNIPGFKPGQNFRYLKEHELIPILNFRKG